MRRDPHRKAHDELVARLNTVELDGRPVSAGILDPLRRLVSADAVVAYRLETAPVGPPALTYYQDLGLRTDSGAIFGALMRKVPTRWGYYDPSFPDPRQRNKLLTERQTARLTGIERPYIREVGYPAVGLTTTVDQMRMLLCNGGELECWLGAFREDAFTPAEYRRLSTLVPAFVRRARANALLRQGEAASAALEACLEQLPAAALVIGERGRVLHANAAGRQALDSRSLDVPGLLTSLRAGRAPEEISAVEIRRLGIPNARLVLIRTAEGQSEQRARAAAVRYGLTARQAEVLALALSGKSNKEIAHRLRCSFRTVDIHVSAILARTGFPSRSALAANLWSR